MIRGGFYSRNRMPNPKRFKDIRKKPRFKVIERITFIISTVGDQTNNLKKADDRIHHHKIHNIQRPRSNGAIAGDVPAAPHNTTSYIMSSRVSSSPCCETAPFTNFDEYGSMRGVLKSRAPAAREGTGDSGDELERLADTVTQGGGQQGISALSLRSLQLRVRCQEGRIAELVEDSEELKERMVSLEQELAAFRRRVCVLELSGGVGLVEVACSCDYSPVA